MSTLRIIVWWFLGLFTACAGGPPAVEALLAEGGENGPFSDRRLGELLAAAQDATATPADWLGAAQALFENADLRIQRAIQDDWKRRIPTSLEELLDAEDRLGAGVRGEVLALCTEGHALTLRVLEQEPQHPGARLYCALHSSLIAWSKTTLQALAGGWGPRVSSAIEAALVGDPTRAAAAPLRLKGRFLARAPWPYRDSVEALRLLEAAASAAPVALNWLFLGDARFAAGDRPGARDAWLRVSDATAGAGSRAALEYHRSGARLRLDLL